MALDNNNQAGTLILNGRVNIAPGVQVFGNGGQLRDAVTGTVIQVNGAIPIHPTGSILYFDANGGFHNDPIQPVVPVGVMGDDNGDNIDG